MKTKTFDCIASKDRAQQKLTQKLAFLTPEQQLVYFQKLHQELLERQKKLKKAGGEK